MADQKHSNWFETQDFYDGEGKAEFTSPRGVIEGPTRVSFDELGLSAIEMSVKRIDCEKELTFDQIEFSPAENPKGTTRHQSSESDRLKTRARN